MKKFVCFLLCAVLLCACCPLAGASVMDEPDAEEYIEYSLAGGVAYFHPGKGLVAWASGLKGDVTVPAEFDGVPVKRLTEFAGNKEMTSITLPEGLEAVEVSSFAGCPKLQTIRLSSTVREMPYGGHDVGNASFQVAEGSPWFSADSQGVLYNKEKTVLVRCPTTVTEYTVPEGVTELGPNCFSECRKLKSLTLPESLQTIGLAALAGCSGLTALHIPKNVTEIGDDMAWLNAVFTVDEENPSFTADSQGALYNKDMTTLLWFPPKREAVSIPASVTEIGDGAFIGSVAKEIVLPAGLQAIGDMAFNSCANLTALQFPQGLRSIGENAFSNCALVRAELPDSLERLGNGAFSGYGLQSLILPDDIAEVGDFFVDAALCYVEKGSPMEKKLMEQDIPYRYGRPEDYPQGLPDPLRGTPYIDMEPWANTHEGTAVKAALKEGWMQGESGLHFGPDHAATRAMVVTTLYRLDGNPEPSGKSGFSDVKPGSYYEKAATWAGEQGILYGFKGKMRPDQPVTKEEAAAILYRYLLYTGHLDWEFTPPSCNYQDRDDIAPWAREAVDALAYWSVYNDGDYPPDREPEFWWERPASFFPRQQMTRVELACMLTAVSTAGAPME